MTKVLLDAGADVAALDLSDEDGDTPVHFAVNQYGLINGIAAYADMSSGSQFVTRLSLQHSS